MKEKSEQKKVKKNKELKQAVALEYTPGMTSAPKVVASGQGLVAEKIIEAAEEYNIPLKKDPVLVEALGQLKLGDEIPPELYQVVAEILAFIMELDKEKG